MNTLTKTFRKLFPSLFRRGFKRGLRNRATLHALSEINGLEMLSGAFNVEICYDGLFSRTLTVRVTYTENKKQWLIAIPMEELN